jgi:hypothetical protein
MKQKSDTLVSIWRTSLARKSAQPRNINLQNFKQSSSFCIYWFYFSDSKNCVYCNGRSYDCQKCAMMGE